MKFKIFLILLLIHSCSESNKAQQKVNNSASEIVKKDFQLLLNSQNLEGVILIYDSNQDKYYSNNFDKGKIGSLPASTFKIPNSIIGLETGNLKDEQSIFYWDGNDRAFTIWEKDLSLRDR